MWAASTYFHVNLGPNGQIKINFLNCVIDRSFIAKFRKICKNFSRFFFDIVEQQINSNHLWEIDLRLGLMTHCSTARAG